MKGSKYRYRVLALLFIATTINYMDRSIIGVLAPTLQYKVFNWSDVDYANINIAFKVAYAIGMLTMGALIDRLGTKKGYTLSIAIWSIFGMLHALVKPAFSVIGFILARFGLGFGESGNFPSALKTVAEWFPKRDRAFATGIFNAGANVGAILAPLCIPLVVTASGENWQYAFLLTGIFSFIWVVLWLLWYKKPEDHPKVNKIELEYINSDQDEIQPAKDEKLNWFKVLPKRQTWAFAIGKLTDAAWWFYLFWTGKFLFDQFGLNIKNLALPLIIIYLMADVGSIVGGWVSKKFMAKGWSLNKARKTTMLLCTICILPVMFTTSINTKFVVDDHFIDKISNVLSADNQENTDQKINDDKKAELITILVAMKDNKFNSAREFMDRIQENAGPGSKQVIQENEDLLINTARNNNLYWIAVLLIAFAAAGHQAWSANLLTLPSDVFPKKAVASVVGIGGMVGAIAGLIADFSLGQVLHSSGPTGYFFAFLFAGLIYLFCLLIIHLLIPKMRPLDNNLELI